MKNSLFGISVVSLFTLALLGFMLGVGLAHAGEPVKAYNYSCPDGYRLRSEWCYPQETQAESHAGVMARVRENDRVRAEVRRDNAARADFKARETKKAVRSVDEMFIQLEKLKAHPDFDTLTKEQKEQMVVAEQLLRVAEQMLRLTKKFEEMQ